MTPWYSGEEEFILCMPVFSVQRRHAVFSLHSRERGERERRREEEILSTM